MLIDWFTVGAQIVNFLVLVALLRRFLYGPIVKTMDERQARLSAQTAAAEAERRQAEQESEQYRLRRNELEASREALLAETRGQAEARRVELVAEARREVEETRARWHGVLRQEKDSFLADLRRRVGVGAVEVARRALVDLADADLEERIAGVFVQRLRAMGQEEWEPVARTIGESANAAVVQSAFPIAGDGRAKIEAEIRRRVPLANTVQFELAPDLVGGIELRSQGVKISWNIADYLQTLEADLADLLADEAREPRPGQASGSGG